VAHDRTFVINSLHATLPDPVYHYPFLQFAEATLAVNTLGMAQHFLDECAVIFNRKGISAAPFLHQKLQDSITALDILRQQFYVAVEYSWNVFVPDKQDDFGALQNVSATSRQMVSNARAIVQELYPFCGMIAADKHSTINRISRDIFTASQHSLLNFPAA